MNCMSRLKKRSLLSLCCFAFCFCAWASDSGAVVLTSEQRTMIRQELSGMRSELNLLRTQSMLLQTDSLEWQNKCSLLEQKLTKASQDLENSEKSVIELAEQVRTLRGLLDELRSEYAALNQSCLRQKKAARFWRATTGVIILISVIEGAVIFVTK